MSKDAREALIRGDYQRCGSLDASGLAFEDPILEGLRLAECAELGVDPRARAAWEAAVPRSGLGGLEHLLRPDQPLWPLILQASLERSSTWADGEILRSRLLGAYFEAFLNDTFYFPRHLSTPANVEHFLLHLGKSLGDGTTWQPRPQPGYTGNGAATFEDVGGGRPSYAAAASSRAFLAGLGRYGWATTATGYAPGGRGEGHGCPVFSRPGGQRGEAMRPRPGDVVLLKTASSPLSGHVATVAWAETDGTAAGDIWVVSGFSAHASVACDYLKITEAQSRPPRGFATIATHYGTADVLPDRLESLPEPERRRLGFSRREGEFPKTRMPERTRPRDALPPPPPAERCLASVELWTKVKRMPTDPVILRVAAPLPTTTQEMPSTTQERP